MEIQIQIAYGKILKASEDFKNFVVTMENQEFSINLIPMSLGELDVLPEPMTQTYEIQIAYGKILKASEDFKNFVVTMENQEFSINLIPMSLGELDVIIGMDWLTTSQAEIVYKEKLVKIPLTNQEILVVYGEKRKGTLNLIPSAKMMKYLRKGHRPF